MSCLCDDEVYCTFGTLVLMDLINFEGLRDKSLCFPFALPDKCLVMENQ